MSEREKQKNNYMRSIILVFTVLCWIYSIIFPFLLPNYINYIINIIFPGLFIIWGGLKLKWKLSSSKIESEVAKQARSKKIQERDYPNLQLNKLFGEFEQVLNKLNIKHNIRKNGEHIEVSFNDSILPIDTIIFYKNQVGNYSLSNILMSIIIITSNGEELDNLISNIPRKICKKFINKYDIGYIIGPVHLPDEEIEDVLNILKYNIFFPIWDLKY